MRRAMVAAVLAAIGAGTGCCKTCGWCCDDAAPPARTGYVPEGPPPGGVATPTVTPPARPAGTGAYGGTGN